ncbi:hypothetical protein [Streptomyces sp. NBC_00091]|uniref:hypothetical protein n=1 Tax=Streptomyces sp. NBC_00091 TaxID=2975648 RepID=UPI0022565F3F|nr:hypothetical protein [Streptomyces sp. NBC_00091]MCX5380455.1 hypothetical protein [Streptomyces sp. NBC_00091]
MPARAAARTAAVLAAAALALPLATAGTAQAAEMPQGEFNWSGDQGDGFDDQARWYGPGQGDKIDVAASADHRTLRVTITRPGDSWTMDLAAPAGQALAAGTYENAAKTPEMPGTVLDQPSMFVNGYYGGCATLTGRFTISELVFGEGSAVKKINLSYEQDCDDRSVLKGYLMANDVTPPKPVVLGMTVNGNGRLSKTGKATLNGTVTCTKPVKVSVGGSASQEQPKFVQGFFRTEVDCVPGKTIAWQAPVQVHTPETDTPFIKSERLKVFGNASTADPDLGTYVTVGADKWVNLR